MKNYLKICLKSLAVFSIILLSNSCSDDDGRLDQNYTLNATTDVITNVTVSSVRSFVSETDDLNYSVSLDRTFDSDADVRIEVEFDDTRFFRTNLTVPAGETSASGVLVFRADDGIDLESIVLEDFIKVRALSILPSQPKAGESYPATSNDLLLDLVSEVGAVTLNIDWTGDSSVDIDFALLNLDTFTFPAGGVTGATLSKPETLVLSNSNAGLPDGNYLVLYRSYSSTTGPVDLNTTIIDASGNSFDISTLTNPSIENPLQVGTGWTTAKIAMVAVKSTSEDGTVSWTFSNPSN